MMMSLDVHYIILIMNYSHYQLNMEDLNMKLLKQHHQNHNRGKNY